MTGNSFGKLFVLTTFGESHGPAIGGIVDGCPAGLLLSEACLQQDLNRRKPGTSRYTSQRREPDTINILSGVFEGKTTGTPIGLLIANEDQKSKDYSSIKDKFRPGHADYTYYKKYGIRDYRGAGRSSARETAIRVAAGAIAKKYLKMFCNFEVVGYVQQMHDIKMETIDLKFIETNPFFCPDPNKISLLEEKIKSLLKVGDSCGAMLTIIAKNIPAGLGEPVFHKLDAAIAQAMMSINAVKGVEIGAGFQSICQKGSEHRDEMNAKGFLSNHAGGILGGITTGQDIVVNLAIKPTSSIRIPGKTIDIHGNETEIVTTGRHDPCVGLRAVPIAQAMLACVIMDFLLMQRAYAHSQSIHSNG